jgi:lysozyme family protein
LDLFTDVAIPWILDVEGVKNTDQGGDTCYGISRNAHPNEPWPPTKERAIQIYKTEYWDHCQCDRLPAPLALALFDGAVNQTPGWATVQIQKLLGVDGDGLVGPTTVEAARKCKLFGTLDASGYHPGVIDAFAEKRLAWYLGDPPGQRLGLINRLLKLLTVVPTLVGVTPEVNA